MYPTFQLCLKKNRFEEQVAEQIFEVFLSLFCSLGYIFKEQNHDSIFLVLTTGN